MKGADAIHAASALARRCSTLQKYDRDYEKIKQLIDVDEPKQISPQASLFAAAPKPDDFKWPLETETTMQIELTEIPAGLLGSGQQPTEVEAEKPKATDEGGPRESGS